MTQSDIMWLAGILEGEGCFQINQYVKNGRTYRYPRIVVGMTDKDIIERLLKVTGEGYIKSPIQPKGNRKLLYHWSVGDRKGVVRLLLAVYPEMGLRRQGKIAEIISVL